MRPVLSFLFLLLFLAACSTDDRPSTSTGPSAVSEAMDGVAESYVKLVLGVGEHDAGYVDAYYGPEAWQDEVTAAAPSLERLEATADSLIAAIEQVDVSGEEEIVRLRHEYLAKQLSAIRARIQMLRGRTFTFDEESLALYDAQAPHHEAADFQPVLDSLEMLLPGSGPLVERVAEFRSDFIIPAERVDTVFHTAIDEARRRTAAHLILPPNEEFVLEFVTNKPWSGYNWYQGDAHSLIQINTDLPIYIDRAIELAAHEGYPGHHVYNALLEQRLVRDRGWMEFTVYPLYSPQSFIAEGSANFGESVAFPGEDRLEYMRDVLFPLAGLDSSRAEEYVRLTDLMDRLSYAGNVAARRYLDGEISAEEAEEWMQTYALMTPDRAGQRIQFIETYRSYVINYNLGEDLVAEWVERQGGTVDNPERRWEVFEQLLATPLLPSGIR